MGRRTGNGSDLLQIKRVLFSQKTKCKVFRVGAPTVHSTYGEQYLKMGRDPTSSDSLSESTRLSAKHSARSAVLQLHMRQ